MKKILLLSAVLIFNKQVNAQISVVTGTTGTTTTVGQSFNETRGVDVKILSSTNIVIQAMTLSDFYCGSNGVGTAYVDARIYDSNTSALLASANDTVQNINGGNITVPISFTLLAGGRYKLCFFCSAPSSPNNAARMFQPQSFPYTEASNSLQIIQAYESAFDAVPNNTNIFVPLIRLSTLTTGINQINVNETSSVYPNPTNENAIIIFQNPTKENCTVTLYDTQGRLLQTISNIVSDKVEIERKNLANGLYYFHISNASQVISTGKIIIE